MQQARKNFGSKAGPKCEKHENDEFEGEEVG